MVTFQLNGQEVEFSERTGERLSEALRERLGARDVKIGCNAGDCGACTVLVDGAAVCACLMPVAAAHGSEVETVAGLVSHDSHAKALAERFEDHHAAQCGICTPGMMVSATALLRDVEAPGESQVQDALGGVLCRCTGYRRIIDAVMGREPAALDGGAVGSAMRRLDGAPKVRGAEVFGDDAAPEDALVLKVIRSPHAHAEFEIGDVSALEGIEAVLTAEDVPGQNLMGVIPGYIDQPVFAEGRALFRGEAVAAVVGTAERMASFDVESFPVSWTPLPEAIWMADAMGAPELHAGRAGNVMCKGLVQCGAPEAGIKRAHVRARGEFGTSFVEHAYIEPEAGFAQVKHGRVEVYTTTQAPVMNQEGLARVLGRDKSEIRVVPLACGGGFGSKLDMSTQPFLAIAALKTGKPVRMAYSRTESMQASTKRHPATIEMEIGADADGKLTGVEFLGRFNTGAYASWGPTVADRVPIHASGPYYIRDYRARSEAIHTNCVPSGAFRGFGVPQTAIAQESLLDELAEQLGMDALEFRIKNALVAGLPTVCGQVFEQGVGIKACLEALRPRWALALAEHAAFNAASEGVKRGVGVASGWYGCGNTSMANPSAIKCGVRPNGQVVIHQGAVDIGQGSNTVITQIFATALGLAAQDIELIGADTDATPDAGKSSASRQTFVTGAAAKRSGEALRRAILARVNAGEAAEISLTDEGLQVTESGRSHLVDLSRLPPDADGYVIALTESYDPPSEKLDENGQGAPYAQFGYAAHLAEVEVDPALGTVRPLGFVAAHDVGCAINPGLVEGQVQGGIAQGLGMALMEEYIPGRTENLHDYLIPTIGDIPPIETLIIEDADAHGPYGAKGLGEHALIPTAAALLNAIHFAVGVRMRRLPVTPSRLHAALQPVSQAAE